MTALAALAPWWPTLAAGCVLAAVALLATWIAERGDR